MRKIVFLLTAILGWAGAATAQTHKQRLQAGWDNFGEPLNYTASSVQWSVAANRKLTVTLNLVGAAPNKLYQLGVDFFCATTPSIWGQFPVQGRNPDGTCSSATRQGVTATVAGVDVGVVTTDLNGTGSFKVVIGPVPSGTYEIEFVVLNGAGCNLTGGAGNNGCYNDCTSDFQSPGPFGTATSITVP